MPRTVSRSTPLNSSWICVGTLLLCVFLIRPLLESGLTDDWSTVRTAQVLAQTGHIVYNGWEAAILGWPLYVAAAFIRIFGPSFTSIRASDLLESVAAVLLLHGTFRRAGLNARNATFGTLALIVTPIYLLASVVFMTDIPGLLAVLVCFYACIRALQTASERAATTWIAFAAISNAVLGTSRQIAWLGVLLMVPGTIWLLRRKRLVVVGGGASLSLSIVLIALAMRWFNHQPYVLEAPVLPPIGRHTVAAGIKALVRTTLDTVLFLLPLALAFLPALRSVGRKTRICLALLALLAVLFEARLAMRGTLGDWSAPFLLFPVVHPQSAENTFTMTQMPVKGPAPAGFRLDLRILVTALVLVGAISLVAGLLYPGKRGAERLDERSTLLHRDLLVLTVPYLAAYMAFLASRGAYNFVYDRYLLLSLPFLLLLLLRSYQDHVAPTPPLACKLLLIPIAAYSTFTLHDVFAIYRATLAACQEAQAAGYPRTAVDGGWEYNHYTQILVGSFVHQVGVRLPDGTVLPNFDTGFNHPCSLEVGAWTPDVQPEFAVAYPNSQCAPVAGFAPIEFRTWLPPTHRTAVVVRAVRQDTHPSVPR